MFRGCIRLEGVYDASGQRINLYGTNLASGQGQGVTLADIQTVKALGFNTFRLNDVDWGWIQPFNETLKGIDQSFFTTGISKVWGKEPYHRGLDQIVNWGVSENMYIIICLGGFQYLVASTQVGFSLDTDDTQRYAALINGTAAKERTGIVNTWRYIANRYSDIPNVMFELLNEPAVLDKSLAGSEYKSFNEEIISAIESVETQPHLKLVELLIDNGSWSEITDTATDVSKSNVVWATHHYAPYDWLNWDPKDPRSIWIEEPFTWHGKNIPAGWGNGTAYVAWRLIRLVDKIHAWNKPWIVTEFGFKVTRAYWEDWYSASLRTMAEYEISGWTFFCYSSDPSTEAGWNIKDPTTQQKIMPALNPYLPARSVTISTVTASSTVSTPFTTTTLTARSPRRAHTKLPLS